MKDIEEYDIKTTDIEKCDVDICFSEISGVKTVNIERNDDKMEDIERNGVKIEDIEKGGVKEWLLHGIRNSLTMKHREREGLRWVLLNIPRVLSIG